MPESFFDFQSRVTKPAAEPEQSKLDRALSVGDLTTRIEAALRAGLPGSMLVRGEISNLNIHAASGHIYFTLKDAKSCIDCVMFRTDAARLKQKPIDGQEVLVTGTVKIYAQRGRYQFYATAIASLGRGALELKFQQLKEKLEKEGMFDADRKRSLPKYPQRIALVTSKQAAALQDMFKVLRRMPWLRLDVHHVPVQGAGASVQIAQAIGRINRDTADLIIVARGGGSLEDLWEFNEEIVARAIEAAALPVITGIGHEVDVSIADLVADYHAHTPTEAAQVAIAYWKQAADVLDGADLRLRRSLRQTIESAKHRLTAIVRHEAFRRPTDRINRFRQLLDDRQKQLRSAVTSLGRHAQQRLLKMESRLHAQHPAGRVAIATQRVHSIATMLAHRQRLRMAAAAGRLDGMKRELDALNPRGVLSRGYSITRLKNGAIVRNADAIKQGTVLTTQVADGSFESVARDPKQPELF